MTYLTTVHLAENLARVMTPVSQMKSSAILAVHSLRNNFKKSKIGNTSKDDLDLLGDDVEVLSGSQADLKGAAKNLFSFPPRL